MSKPHNRREDPLARVTPRRYRSRAVDVEIREITTAPTGIDPHTGVVELTLDGVPIAVSVIDGQYHSQLANQFTAFETIDDLVDTLLNNDGRTWRLHGRIAESGKSRSGGHHHPGGDAPGHQHTPEAMGGGDEGGGR